MRRTVSLAMLVLLAPTPARAHSWPFPPLVETHSFYLVPSYYVPAPVCWVPAPAPVVVPTPAAVPLAVPSPAPPSNVQELPPVPSWPSPPIMPPADPATTTSRRISEPYFDLYPGTTGKASRTGGRASVAFWNLTGVTVRLRVKGRDWALPPRRSLTLDLPRSFSWSIVGRQEEQARLGSDRTAAEILIRR